MKNACNHNFLTIDVEDWYMDTDFSTWNKYENRLIEPTQKILTALKEHNIRATFFVLGYVADNYPDLIERIHSDGHEIGTHGYRHIPINHMTKQSFSEDLKKSLIAIENLTGEPVWGHRAPYFSVMKETCWAIDTLKQAGLRYDSSIFPVSTPLYGVPDAPYFPYQISSNDITQPDPKSDFWEIPLSVYHTFFGSIPVAGGFYARLFPYRFLHHFLKKMNDQGRGMVFYLHPWELDLNHPVIKDIKWYNYYNLSSTYEKFNNLLNDFEFIPIREWIKSHDKRC
jgi:polysaccharide deacetylase family protein (PEP-CTERM system associated)